MKAHWEFKVEPVVASDSAEVIERRFDELGLEGWQLVSVEGGRAYFARRYEPKHMDPRALQEILKRAAGGY